MKHTAAFLNGVGVTEFACIPFSECRVMRPYKCDKIGEIRSVLLFLIPYFDGIPEKRNLSLYAIPRDYHLFVRSISDGLTGAFHEDYPDSSAFVFSDSSPIDEVDAACRAGLGFRGDNRMLIHPRFGPFVFIGEMLTDAVLPSSSREPGECPHCGKCSCGRSVCLSSLTQKKGDLTSEEEQILLEHPLIWGCDDCLLACPYAQNAERTPIPFFRQEKLPFLTQEILEGMSEDAFSSRAWSWRGKAVVERNLSFLKK